MRRTSEVLSAAISLTLTLAGGLALWSQPAGAVTFGSDPLDDVVALGNWFGWVRGQQGCGIGGGETTGLAMTVTWPEVAGGVTSRAPSPATLGRADYGSSNLQLYSNASYAGDVRAFWHMGIGMYQLDYLGDSYNYGLAERINSYSSAIAATDEVSKRWCAAIGTTSDKRHYAWQPWFACHPGGNYATCDNIMTSVLLDLFFGSVTRDYGVHEDGGVQPWACYPAYGYSGPVTCSYWNQSSIEGYTGSFIYTSYDGGGSGSSPSPLASSFFSHPANFYGDLDVRYFPNSGSWKGAVYDGLNARGGVSWNQESAGYLCFPDPYWWCL